MNDSAGKDSICPLCGEHNDCAMAAGREAEQCWCWSAQLDAAALARIPAPSVGKHCICATCGGVPCGGAE